jgi:hypothetical protein
VQNLILGLIDGWLPGVNGTKPFFFSKILKILTIKIILFSFVYQKVVTLT